MFSVFRTAQITRRATAVVLSASFVAATYAAVIPAGPNYFETVPARTGMDFTRDSIPRGFFDPGSDAFLGFIRLQGAPLDPRTLGTTDTIVQRLGNIEVTQNARPVSTGLGLVALSLVSLNPITVTYNLGHNPELWDVRVSLQPDQPAGRMTIMQTSPDGGTYGALLPARLMISFVRRSDNAARDLPFGLLMGTDNNVPWSFNADRILVTDHHFCPVCVAGEPRSAIFAGPNFQWEVQPARGP